MEILDKQYIINHLLASNNFSANLNEVQKVIEFLNLNPTYPIILVSGTNGKGSTCAFLSHILQLAGYKVGSFTSPHVFDYNERIQINNQAINDHDLINALNKVIQHSHVNLGIFKSFTLASHLIFQQYNIDIAIFEVGIGGKLDVTNLFEPTISLITGVGLDHCNLLGNSIEEIALHKAHIYRPQKPALYGSLTIANSVIEHTKQIEAKLIRLGTDYNYINHQYGWDFISPQQCYYSLPYPSLRGNEQLLNASLAIAGLLQLRNKFPVTLNQIKQGLLETTLVGRFEVLAGLPQVVLDTAHNPQAVDIMCKNMLKLSFAKRNFAVLAVAEDKNWSDILKQSQNSFDYWYLAPLNSSRTSNPQLLAQHLKNHGVKAEQIILCDDLDKAITICYQQLNQDDRMVCFGSFLVVEQAHRIINKVRA
ncbi:MAG: hypothetical protein RLZZ293_135, partial [Pseudomonadota bacterium]|jgi:dihydrofolate synthase/folylpolyglutamate synthase